jgi:RNA polymerase sigma-70 factor (sigma-E family)
MPEPASGEMQRFGGLRHLEVVDAVGVAAEGEARMVTEGAWSGPPVSDPTPVDGPVDGPGDGWIETSSTLEELWAERRPGLLRLAYLLTGSRAVAEDVVQDAFVQLHRKWSGVRAPAPYLRTSVVNGCRMHHRGRSREQARFAELVGDAVQPETPVVLDALVHLPYRQRAALVLRYYEDRPEAEIADLLGCRPATVRSLVHRGLAALREAMEE